MNISSKIFIYVLMMYYLFQFKSYEIKQLERFIERQRKKLDSRYYCKYVLAKFVDRNLKKILGSDICFVRSYICVMLLKRYGYAPSLYIGAYENEDNLSSHAWVKEGDDILFESKDAISNYNVLTVFK